MCQALLGFFFFFFLPAYLASDLGVLREALQACRTPGCIFYSAELVFGPPKPFIVPLLLAHIYLSTYPVKRVSV